MPSDLPLILVVDDDEDLRVFMLDLLSAYGYQVITWKRAQGAHAAMRRAMPALVITDLGMEHQTAGLDVLSALHADTATAAIPAILYSAALHILDGEREALQAAGMRQDWDHESHSGRVGLCRSLQGWPLCRHQLAHQRLKPGTVCPSLV